LTLTMTIVAPWGVWQCSDHRVTYLVQKPNRQWRVVKREDESVKHVQLGCKDGVALLAYSGLAKIGNDHISDWLRRLVRGQSGTVDETLIRIREGATATLAGPAAKAGVAHAFVIGTFVQGQPWMVAIVNQELPDSPPLDHFRTEGLAAWEPKTLIVGEGRDAVSEEDRALVERAAQRRPRRPEEYSELLAAVHRRAKHSKEPEPSKRSAHNSISEACITSYLLPGSIAVHSMKHWGKPDPSGKDLPPVPLLISGIDTTETTKVFLEHTKAMWAGEPIDEAEYERRMDKAGRRSVEPPKP
jgi:hypothetical protein